MGASSLSSTSTPSTDSSIVSTRSGFPPGAPQPPINPPRRRSSLAFSQIVTQHAAVKDTEPVETMVLENQQLSTPTRSLSNVGRKRALASPLTRSTATLGHVAQMQKIFSNAKASLHLDVRFAASPAGSIGSRLPPNSTPKHEKPPETDSLAVSETKSSGKSKDWRYSTIPFQLTDKNTDVREPFPEESSLLPNPLCVDIDQSRVFMEEPISSGFTSPVDSDYPLESVENDPLLPRMPDTELLTAKRGSILNNDQDLDGDDYQPGILISTELEQPLTDLSVSKHKEEADAEMDDSPIVSHLNRQSGATITNQHLSGTLGSEIFLSTPARAAAESAKAKRGILKGAFRVSSNKENIDPRTDNSTFNSIGSCESSMPPCPNPGVHNGLPVALCPDPSVHYQGNAPGWLGPPHTHLGPPPGAPGFYPSPSPLRASFQPIPPFHRASATGSPMPILKGKSPPQSPNDYPRTSYFSPPRQAGQRRPIQTQRLPSRNQAAPSIADHFQPGWYYAAPPAAGIDSMAYSFSTAAAKVVGSSPAPDSRIRDSYRTDTLTPLARPTTRFRKNGIGAVAATRGVSKYCGNGDAHDPRPRSRVMYPGIGRTPDQPRFMSSPPRPIGVPIIGLVKRRRGNRNGGDFAIVEDDMTGAGTKSKEASILSGESVEPMELDEDIRAAVRMSIGGMPEGDEEMGDMEAMSPNVTPFRKGMEGKKSKRRLSYWDEDLKEVADSPAGRRARGVMSSPLKGGYGDEDEERGRRTSFDEQDLSGEMDRAGEVFQRRLSGRVDGVGVGTGTVAMAEIEMGGC